MNITKQPHNNNNLLYGVNSKTQLSKLIIISIYISFYSNINSRYYILLLQGF